VLARGFKAKRRKRSGEQKRASCISFENVVVFISDRAAIVLGKSNYVAAKLKK
jgi:hypothetical protein